VAPPPARETPELDDAWASAVSADGDDTVVRLLIQPRASKSRVVGLHDGRLKVAVAAPPVDGAANKALVRLLAKALGVGRGALSIEAGATGRRKRLRVHGAHPEEVVARLTR